MRTSVFTCAGRFYFSTVRIRHELCTIADTQNRILSANVTQIDFKGAFIINREGASRKDNADYGRIIVWKFVVRHNLAISIQFANATGYELCGSLLSLSS